MQLQHLTTIPFIPVHTIYQHLLNNTLTIIPFDTESTENTDSLWTLFAHLGIYISAIGFLIPVGIGLFCCYLFWCQPARLVCQPLQPGNTQYTIVDDNVEVAPIYRCDGMESQPTRPHENHGLAMEHLPTQLDSQCKTTVEVIGSACSRIIGKIIQNPGDTEMYIISAARLRFDISYNINNLRIEQNRRRHNNS